MNMTFTSCACCLVCRSSSGGSQESTGGASEGVLACNFSPDGTKFVTSSQNGLIRVRWLSGSSVAQRTLCNQQMMLRTALNRTGLIQTDNYFVHDLRIYMLV